MKKVLLISNKVMKYRIEIYNYFYEEMKKSDYEFIVLCNSVQNTNSNNEAKFKLIQQNFNFAVYSKLITEIKPDFIILFLHLKDRMIFKLIALSKFKKIPIIYWNHGIDRQHPKSIKNILYYFIHDICDALITYFPDNIHLFKKRNRKKLFVANNSLNYDYYPKNPYNKSEFRNKYNIKEEKVILFVSRISPERKLDLLLNQFKNTKYAVVIVGKGLNEVQKTIIDKSSNLYYLGAIYDDYEINSIFNSSDVFCIPGANGLSINQSLYWGKPIVTMNVYQGPEIYLVKSGVNGFVVEDEKELKEKICYLLDNDDIYLKFSQECKNIIKKEGNIKLMLNGFISAISYCENRSGHI